MARVFGPQAFLCVVALLGAAGEPVRAQNPSPEPVGHLAGADVAVKGQVSFQQHDGRQVAELASGSEVTVRSGPARIRFNGGGEIGICGPAQFSVLKSGSHVTVALNYGRVHAQLAGGVVLTIYTPQVIAAPLAIAGGERDSTLGLDAGGGMCAYAGRGAVRLEQQLTGAAVVLPEGAEVEFPDSQLAALREAAGACRCDALAAVAKAADSTPHPAAGTGAREDPKPVERARGAEPLPATAQPVWTAVMPPLVFDAKSPDPPAEPSPQIAVLIRELRIQPETVLRGRVESPVAEEEFRRSASASTGTVVMEGRSASGGFGRKFLNFFRRIFGGKPRT